MRRRAGEGIRTLDVQLGRLMLYQLSYSREEPRGGSCDRRSPRTQSCFLVQCLSGPECARRNDTYGTITSGGCWIRTNVGNAGRFTACSLWPLGQPSRACREQNRASGGTRTPNHLFTKQVLCQLSYASRKHTPTRTSREAARGCERREGEASSVHRQVRQWARCGLLDRTARAPKKRGTPPFIPLLASRHRGRWGGVRRERGPRSAGYGHCQA